MKKKLSKANISLTLVLVISAIFLAAGLALTIVSIDTVKIEKDYRNAYLADIRSKSCIEESIFKLKNNNTYTGTVTVTFSDGSCTSIVTGSGSTKTLTVTSVLGSYNYQVVKTVNLATTPYTVQ